MVFLSILSLLGYCVAVKRLCHWSMATIPFFVITTLTSFLYLLGLFGFLAISAKVFVLAGLVLLFLMPWYAARDDWVTQYITPGFLLLILFCIFFGFFATHAHIHLWDEFEQWGARAKLVATQHTLFTQSTVLAHPNYPPGTAVFYYWFFAFSPYSEGLAYLAQQLLILLPLGVLIKDYSWQRWQRAFLALSFVVLILLVLHVRMASNVTLYVDNLIGIYFGIILVSYYFSKRSVKNIFFLIPPVFFLMLLKDYLVGFLFFITAILIIDQINRATHRLKRMAVILLLLVTGLAAHYSWPLFLHIHHSATFNSHQTLLIHSLTAAQHNVEKHFMLSMLTYLPTIIAILAVAIATILLARQQKRQKEIIWFHSLMLIGFVLYVLTLLWMYLYRFSPYEATHLASLPRYLKIYFVAWGLVAFATLLPEWRVSVFGRHRYLSGVMTAMALIAFPTYLFYNHYWHIQQDNKKYSLLRLRHSLQPLVNAARKAIPANGKVFLVWQNSKGFERVILGYELIPRDINPQPSSFGQPHAQGDVWTQNVSRWRLKQMMQTYNYILLAHTGEKFWQTYGDLFHARLKHELVEYLLCQRTGFNGVGQPGCWSRAVTAYLYKKP